MTSKFNIDNRELLQRISSGEAVVGIDFGNLIVRELAAFRLAAMDSEPVAWTWQHLKQWHVINAEDRARDLAWDGVKVEPLYRHAQQPVDSELVGYLFHNEYGAVLYSISYDATEGFSLIGPIYSVP